jgi:hypothetical protein
MTDENFSTWVQWKERNTIDSINHPGIYIISYSLYDVSGKPFSFSEDIKCIGMTNNQTLKVRLKQFNETVKGDRNTHGVADRMRYEYRNYDELLPNLYVSVLSVPYNPREITTDNLIAMGNVAKLEFVFLQSI